MLSSLLCLCLALGIARGSMMPIMARLDEAQEVEDNEMYKWAVYSHSESMVPSDSDPKVMSMMQTLSGSGIMISEDAILSVKPDRSPMAKWRIGSKKFDAMNMNSIGGVEAMPLQKDIRTHPLNPLITMVRLESPVSDAMVADFPMQDIANGTDCEVVGWQPTKGHLAPGLGHMWEMMMMLFGGGMPKNMASGADEAMMNEPFFDPEKAKEFMNNDEDMTMKMQEFFQAAGKMDTKEMMSKAMEVFAKPMNALMAKFQDRIMANIMSKSGGEGMMEMMEKLMAGSTATQAMQVMKPVTFISMEECQERYEGWGMMDHIMEMVVCVVPRGDVSPHQCPYPTGSVLVCDGQVAGVFASMFDQNRCKYNWPQVFLDLNYIREWMNQECDNCFDGQ